MRELVYYRTLGELAAYFLRLGVTAFGGPAAHIALMEEDCVRRRKWITPERFLDVLGASSLIPGPTSTELAMHIGHARAGWPGFLLAGICFIAPPAVIVGVLAALYVRAGALPAVDGMLRGVKPAVVAAVLVALVSLGRTALRTPSAVAVACGAGVLALAGVNELVVLVIAAVAHAIVRSVPRSAALAVVPMPWPDIFRYFVEAGTMVIGSGYVLLPILRNGVIERRLAISEEQLLDAIAVGQLTPGPLFTTATFIGYLLDDWRGAIAATVGIFLPAFAFSALSINMLHRLRNSRLARNLLDGVNAGAVSVIGVVLIELARHAIVDLPTAALAAGSLVLIAWLRVNAAWVIVGCAAIGLLL